MFGSLRPYVAFYNSGWDSLQNCKNKGLKGVLGPCFAREIKKLDSNFVSKLESRGGGEGGIRTLAPVIPAYSLSRGAPSAMLGYFSTSMQLAEREGFEPPVPFDITSFQDWRLKPLGHLSTETPAKIILPDLQRHVNSVQLNCC